MRKTFRTARLTAGFQTQRELAERLGVSTHTINKIELGQRKPSVTLALRLESVLKESIARLMEEQATEANTLNGE
jgi:DNA-binding XRE family transcriptional regulator